MQLQLTFLLHLHLQTKTRGKPSQQGSSVSSDSILGSDAFWGKKIENLSSRLKKAAVSSMR